MNADELSAAWAHVGGGLSVAPSVRRVDLEELVARTAQAAPSDARLFWVAVSWVAVHHALVNVRRLAVRIRTLEPAGRAAAGAMLDAAAVVGPVAARLSAAARACEPLAEPRPLFDTMAAHPVLALKAREGALPVFARWGFWQDDLSPRTDAIRPVAWVLSHCPELRSRALFGAGLDAEIFDVLLAVPATVRDLSTLLGVTYASAHEAASRLVDRGWLVRVRDGRRRVLTVREGLRAWYESYPPLLPTSPDSTSNVTA